MYNYRDLTKEENKILKDEYELKLYIKNTTGVLVEDSEEFMDIMDKIEIDSRRFTYKT